MLTRGRATVLGSGWMAQGRLRSKLRHGIAVHLLRIAANQSIGPEFVKVPTGSGSESCVIDKSITVMTP